jgi:hypothetical protein
MPQLDSLTYCSQFIYLVISFIGVYQLTLGFIIPSVVAAQKLRQKLNTVALLENKLDVELDLGHINTKGMSFVATSFGPGVGRSPVNMLNTYELLAINNLKYFALPKRSWLNSTRMVQFCQTIGQKKSVCARTIYMAKGPVTNNVVLAEFVDDFNDSSNDY